jgi:ABC-type lipoprotein export system ATPase subunit
VNALNGVSFKVKDGAMVAIMGRSGCGKSTLMNLLGTLDHPTSGRVRYFGDDVSRIRDLPRFRLNTIGFVFQLHCLLPHLDLLDNVSLPLFGQRGARERARKALEEVGLGHRLGHLPATVSGGERQRAAIARAIVNEPRVLLADEPTGNVDNETEEQLLRVFAELRQRRGMTLVVVTHDWNVASRAERVILFKDGRVDREGAPQELREAVPGAHLS